MRLLRINLTVIVAAIFLACGSTQAATLSGIGIKGGLAFMNIRDGEGESYPSPSSNTGYCIGGFATISFGKNFALQPELLLNLKNTEYSLGVEYFPISENYKLNYLEIPILAKLMIPTQSAVSPNLYCGPTLGINLNSKREMHVWILTAEEDFKTMLYGAVIGGGVDIDMGKWRLLVDIRYGFQIAQFDETYSDDAVFAETISVLTGVTF